MAYEPRLLCHTNPDLLGDGAGVHSGTEKVPQRTFATKISGAICLKYLVLPGSAPELFRRFFSAVREIFWLWGSFFWLLIHIESRSKSGHPQRNGKNIRARKRHINFEHINFLKVGTTLGQPAG